MKPRNALNRIRRAAGFPAPTRGANLYRDLRIFLPNLPLAVVFDVGANVGQSAAQYLRHFPQAEVHSFEPVNETYQRLQRRFKRSPQFHAHRLALGAQAGSTAMSIEGPSVGFRILDEEPRPGSRTEDVPVTTLDQFCGSAGLQRINFLKIDTEGFDLEVLKGAERLLRESRIDAVQVEAGMNPENDWHVSFEALKSHLEERAYFLFALYEQMGEWPTRQPQLRRTNPLFISREMIAANTRRS